MPSSSSEYKIPDFVLREAKGVNADQNDVAVRTDAEGWMSAVPNERASSANGIFDTARAANSTSEDWSIYQELTAIAEEIQRCRAGVL